MAFYGHYRSAGTTSTGCVKEFMTKPQDKAAFPPNVEYYCDLCSATHRFRFTITHTASTPRQVKRFEEYCEARGIEADVEVTK